MKVCMKVVLIGVLAVVGIAVLMVFALAPGRGCAGKSTASWNSFKTFKTLMSANIEKRKWG